MHRLTSGMKYTCAGSICYWSREKKKKRFNLLIQAFHSNDSE